MASTKFKVVRLKLIAARKQIQDQIDQLKNDDFRPMDERRDRSLFDKEEEAAVSTEVEQRASLENRLNLLLGEVERALQKVDDGSYGICDVCQTRIDPARTEALPQAILCMNCRQKSKNA